MPNPPTVSVSLDRLADLGVAWWRLRLALGPAVEAPGAGALRHALRKIEDFCTQHGIEARSLDGQPYDPGLAARVVDTLDDDTLAPGQCRISETLSPLVLVSGTVLRPAEIIVSRART
jgi:hypothetical protein